MDKQFSNHLIHETSPYLLQHAHNPVEWFPWGDAAFKKAKDEDKPILVSIGYAACHWCHVMEHESFENPATAEFMNTYFVNIKVDREERPDVDHIYMNACQLLTGAGGWPLNVFLTPEKLPFSGGTYFPPKPAYGKPSWLDVLMYMKNIFANERDKVEEQAQLLKEHLLKMDNAFIDQTSIGITEKIFTKEEINTAVKSIEQQFDLINGGFGNAPKFPGAMTLLFLVRYNFFEPNEQIEKQIHLSLRKMMLGGIYDHLAGGFARYTVDSKWMIPHFEKMLYDNALLVSLYSEAYRASSNADYAHVVTQTLHFIETELMSSEYGFYASYDADSEGEEGKFYTFTQDELFEVLKDDFEFAKTVFNCTPTGNWEHTNILFRTQTDAEIAAAQQIDTEAVRTKLNSIEQRLLKYRNQRIKPGLDDKIILSWNAMMCAAFVQAYKALGNEHYRNVAVQNIEFILKAFTNKNKPGSLLHTYKNGTAKYPAFIEDYATCIQALLDVYGITGNDNYLEQAVQFTDYVKTHFAGGDGLYFYTEKNQADVPYRSKDFYDNATPSGNSVMVNNLLQLAILTGNQNYYADAEKMVAQLKINMLKHGTSFGNWLTSALTFIYPFAETAITGLDAENNRDVIYHYYYPHLIIQTDTTGEKKYPLLQSRFVKGENKIYLCQNQTCKLPVSNVQDFIELLNKF